MDSLLSILIWLPILGSGSVLLIGNNRSQLARWVSVGISVLVFILSINLFQIKKLLLINRLLIVSILFLSFNFITHNTIACRYVFGDFPTFKSYYILIE